LLTVACLPQPTSTRTTDKAQTAAGATDDWVVVWLGDGPTHTELDPATNYVIMLPDKPKNGPTALEGGRNIIVPGGHIVMSRGETDLERRALYIKDATGTVRIEDLFIEGTDNAEFDAIAISAPEAVVELINIRVEDVHGTFAGFHGDIVQPFGGVRKLYVNGLTGYSSYQGFYLYQTSGAIGSVELWNVNLGYNPNPDDNTTFLLWLEGCSSYPITLRNVYIQPRENQKVIRHAVQPNDVEPRQCRATQEGDSVWWPKIQAVDGRVIEGTPPAGDFVPALRWELGQIDLARGERPGR
jgi:hypothetical protein